jgi:hypothetical protein
MAIIDPSVSGPSLFDRIVYANPGMDYSNSPLVQQYQAFESPMAQFESRAINISLFADSLGAYQDSADDPPTPMPWTFNRSSVPLNGLARVPHGPGPFPLIVFAHGNHDPRENSTPGYLYLCDLLASHGFIAVTIDVNFLNGIIGGENDARAIVHLEHIKQFAIWNGMAGHPLQNRVDLSKVMIVGHSRGGEAVGHASYFRGLDSIQPDPSSPTIPLDGTQGLGPYQFDIKAVVAIAPTDGQYMPVNGPTRVPTNYLVMHGSRDGDVSTFEGYKTYDRSHRVDLGNPLANTDGIKALLWIHGANHNSFNTIWASEDWFGLPEATIDRERQQLVAKCYITAMSLSELKGDVAYLKLLQNHEFGIQNEWVPDILYSSQFQGRERIYIHHAQEPSVSPLISSPLTGNIQVNNGTAQVIDLDLGETGHLFQESRGVRLSWVSMGARYRMNVSFGAINPGNFNFFSMRIGQSFEDANRSFENVDLSITFGDVLGNSALIPIRLVHPDPVLLHPQVPQPKTVMQSVRVPLGQLMTAGLDVSQLSMIQLDLGIETGTIYFNDVQLTN